MFSSVFRRIERFALAFLMLAMVGLYSGGVAVRELAPSFASRVAWVDEATRILLVWLVFLGLGAALARGSHIAMSTLLERFTPPVQRQVGRLIDAVGFLFSVWLVVLGWRITLVVLNAGQVSPTLGMSMAWLYAALPIGFALLALRYFFSLIGVIDRRAEPAPPESLQ